MGFKDSPPKAIGGGFVAFGEVGEGAKGPKGAGPNTLEGGRGVWAWDSRETQPKRERGRES